MNLRLWVAATQPVSRSYVSLVSDCFAEGQARSQDKLDIGLDIRYLFIAVILSQEVPATTSDSTSLPTSGQPESNLYNPLVSMTFTVI